MRKGFFFDEAIPVPGSKGSPRKMSKGSTGPKPKPRSLLDEADPCSVCGLHALVRSPRLGITGKGRLGILFMGEAQASHEDAQGKQFVGDAGQKLRGLMRQLGLDFERDFFAINAVRCATFDEKGNSRNPDDREISLCWRGTWDLIRELKPRAIWTSGLVPLQSYLIEKGQEKPTMARWRGWAIPDQELGSWVCPMYHPSFLKRNDRDTGLHSLFLRDMARAVEISQKSVPIYEPLKHITIIKQEGDVLALLRRVLDEKPSFLVEDFETTGLKPHREGHDIKYAALCWDNHSWAFSTKNPEIKGLLGEINECPEIGLGAHNIQFEDLWARVRLGVTPTSWAWDSETAAHVLDDRSKIISLEFQAAVRYSDWHFKKATDPYLKPPQSIIEEGIRRKTGANDFNRIDQCPEDDILLRVAKDALYGAWLSYDQMEEIQQVPKPTKRGHGIEHAYWLFHDATLSLGETMVDGGLIYDRPYFDQIRMELDWEIKALRTEILATHPARIWMDKVGKEINPGSDDQVRKLLFNFYKLKALGWTQGGDKESVTHDTLLTYSDHPHVGEFCRLTLQYNKKVKLLSTYIDGFRREAVPIDIEGKEYQIVYPFIGINIPRTYRSSSRAPNLQNIPARDEESMLIVRSGLYPWPGHRFLGADYGSHEFIIAACYSQDREMIRYILEGGDPHGDQALRLFMIDRDQLTKELRYIGKNGWVFPQQYGAWYKSCAGNIWNMSADKTLKDGTPTHEWLALKGIKNLDMFTEFCRSEEKIYWQRFAGLKAWQEEWLARYERDGVVPMFHGFRRQGHLSKNEILNSSIQGTGYHLLQESYNEINRIRKEEGWRSRLVGEIHDEIRSSCHPDELEYVMTIKQWVMKDLMEYNHPWIIVPLKVEFKATEIDQPWATEKGIELKKAA